MASILILSRSQRVAVCIFIPIVVAICGSILLWNDVKVVIAFLCAISAFLVTVTDTLTPSYFTKELDSLALTIVNKVCTCDGPYNIRGLEFLDLFRDVGLAYVSTSVSMDTIGVQTQQTSSLIDSDLAVNDHSEWDNVAYISESEDSKQSKEKKEKKEKKEGEESKETQIIKNTGTKGQQYPEEDFAPYGRLLAKHLEIRCDPESCTPLVDTFRVMSKRIQQCRNVLAHAKILIDANKFDSQEQMDKWVRVYTKMSQIQCVLGRALRALRTADGFHEQFLRRASLSRIALL